MGVVIASATQSGMLCVTRMNSIAERANRDALPRLDGLEPIAGIDAVLFELGLDEGECHRRAVDRSVEQLEHVRDGADVILVPVGQNQRLDVVAPRFDEASCPG